MLSIILAIFAVMINASTSLVDALFTKVSITTGNTTITPPINLFGVPAVLIILLLVMVIVLIAFGAFFIVLKILHPE